MSSIIRANIWQDANGTAYNSVLQVVSTNKTDTFSTASTTYTAITGLTVTITPRFITSKILIMANLATSFVTQEAFIRLSGGNAGNFVGDTAGSRIRSASSASFGGTARVEPTSVIYLDSPATASPVTYGIDVIVVSGGTFYLNRSSTDTDSTGFPRGASSITVMEIAQ